MITRKRVLHITSSGRRGGIENLLRDIVCNSSFENTYCALFSSGDILQDLSQRGKKTVDLSEDGLIKKFAKLNRMIKRNNYDVICLHDFTGTFIILCYLINMKNSAYIQFLHAPYKTKYTPKRLRLPIFRFIAKKMYKKADLVLAVSDFVLDNHRSVFGKLENGRVLYNAIDVSRFLTYRENYAYITNSPVRLLYVGRLEYRKGVQIALEACRLLKESGVDFIFTIAGYGSYESELKKMVGDLDITDKVEFFGKADRPEELYVNADFFLHSPIYEEAFGITILEAMASGCIVVAARSGGIPEIIKNGQNGFLTEKYSSSDIANTIKEILALDKVSIENIMAEARQTAKLFTIDSYIKKYEAYISEIAD